MGGIAIVLPVAICVVVATGFLFASLQDALAARILNGVALAIALIWVIDLIALVLLLSFDAASRTDSHADEIGPEEHESM